MSQPSDYLYLSAPYFTGEEQKYLQEAFRSNWIAPAGPLLSVFENKISEYLGIAHAVALQSGTAALHLALKACGVQAGDYVLCPTFTFVATANPILYENACPVLIDSAPDTWNICPQQAEEAIKALQKQGKKPKAMMVVHLYGQPAAMEALLALAKRYDIALIEDAAEALGSTYEGQFLGTLGDVGVLSFNGNKIISTSGGGALLAREAAVAEKVLFWATQAKEPLPYYHHQEIGYNYRLSNVLAALGCGQMEVLAERIARKRAIFDYYKTHLQGLPLRFWEEPAGCFSNRWLSCILLEKEAPLDIWALQRQLAEAHIESRPLGQPLHRQPLFRDVPYFGTEGVAERLFGQGLCLPSGAGLQEADLARVVTVLRRSLQHTVY